MWIARSSDRAWVPGKGNIMSMRRHYFSLLVAASILAVPASGLGARITDTITKLPIPHNSSLGSPHYFHADDDYEIAIVPDLAIVESWGGLELAVPDFTDELELAVASDEDEEETALPDFGDDLELAQAHGESEAALNIADE